MKRKFLTGLLIFVAFFGLGMSNALACQSGWGTYNTGTGFWGGDTALNQGSSCGTVPFRIFYKIKSSYWADGHGRLYGANLAGQGLSSTCADITSLHGHLHLYHANGVEAQSWAWNCTRSPDTCTFTGSDLLLGSGIPSTSGVWMDPGGWLTESVDSFRGSTSVSSIAMKFTYYSPGYGVQTYLGEWPSTAWVADQGTGGGTFCILA